MDIGSLCEKLGVDDASLSAGALEVASPIDGSVIARVKSATADDAATAVGRAHEAFAAWRRVPAPGR